VLADSWLLRDTSGPPYLAFGSFWSGIHIQTLQWPSGLLAPGQTGEPLKLADRFVPPNAVEDAALTYHRGWYYLFVSLDFCCQGVNSTYKIAVGRSRSPTGPYYDRIGTPLTHGGGTVILSELGQQFGPGGPSIAGDFLAYHYYDGTLNGDFRLSIRRIVWMRRRLGDRGQSCAGTVETRPPASVRSPGHSQDNRCRRAFADIGAAVRDATAASAPRCTGRS
jgi:arabinan endo-1,5-alpha-L-arabinosidase